MVALAACGGGGTGGDSAGTATPETGVTRPGSPDPTGTGDPTGPATTAPTPTDESTYLPSPEPELTLPATRLGTLERLSGTVGEGVEHGCRILSPDRGGSPLLLLVEDARVVPGTRVTVEGYRSEGTVTTCQQGVPFTVMKVSLIGPATPTTTN